MSGDIALYVHVPFCRRRCLYCSFVSSAGRESDIPAYVGALKNELARKAEGATVRTVFFGGGTPSLLSVAQFRDILLCIRSLVVVLPGAEVSIEANPGTVDGEYLTAVRQLGVNRLSLGVQSFSDGELKMLGRIHTAEEAKEAFRLARRAGFSNLNLDLIYGLPGQTVNDWQYSLEQALELKPEHLSLYALTLEEDAPLYKTIENAALPEIDPDIAAEQYELAEALLADNGYIHYEISNWAQPGYECQHNLAYWKNLPYLGVGAAAHSCLNGHRTANTSYIDKYVAEYSGQAPPQAEMDESISPDLELAESAILGLRLGEGIDVDYIKNRFGVDIASHYRQQIAEMTAVGLMERYDGHIRLTPRGRLLSNEVFWRLLPE